MERGNPMTDDLCDGELRSYFAAQARRELAIYRLSGADEVVACGVGSEANREGLQFFWRAFDQEGPSGGAWEYFERSRRFFPREIRRRRVEESVAAGPKGRVQPGIVGADDLDGARFRSAVASVIEAGQPAKVVLARRRRIRTENPLDPERLLEALARSHRDCRIFAISPGAELYPLFVGATPERLVEARGGRLKTMALAGTTRQGPGTSRDDAEEQLLRSAKDRQEHRFVRDHIVARLSPFCEDLQAPSEPAMLRLATLSHLHTPIEGRLAEGVSFGEVVDALHPTPAVCGTPQEQARRFIRDHEGFDRGLYAGILGWVDGSGDGEADVLLRAALVDREGATLFAGAGITAASEVDVEWRETADKFQPLMDAIIGGAR